MLGAFGQVQVDALTSVGSTGRRGTVVDCYMAQRPGDGSERRSRQSPIVHLVALRLFIEHGIEGRGTFLRLARLLERRPNFRALGPRHNRGRLGVGSPFLAMRNWAMRTTTRAAPKPGHTRSGEHGARAAQNPESRHQVAVTRLDVHHTVGGSVSERLERVEHARTSVATHQRLRAGRDDRYSARAARIAGALTCVRMGWAWRAGQPGPGSCWPRHVWRLRFSRRRVAGAANGRRCAPGAGRSCRGHHRCRG